MSRRKRQKPDAGPAPIRENQAKPAGRDRYLCLALGLVTLIVFGNVFRHEFIGLDDDIYVVRNLLVQKGLTVEGTAYAFTSVQEFYWHPLTWLSHMFVCQVFGLDAGWHHFVNVLLHSLTAVALFLAFRDLTGAVYRSAAVAALFALHPLRVESVAWVAERKDVLACLFLALSLWAYARYARQTASPKRYALVFLFFLCGVMSKPSVAVLPAILLLLDYWPLARLRRGALWPPLREKLPLFFVSAVCAYLTRIGQSSLLDRPLHQDFTLAQRILNLPLTYLTFVFKTFWPHPLGPFYPYDTIPVWLGLVCWIVLIALTVAVLWLASRAPYLPVGWFWFLGAMTPTLWVLARLDRFALLPSIGLFVLLVWAAADLAARWKLGPKPVAAVTAVILAACALVSLVQLRYWRDRISLFGHAVEVHPRSVTAQNNFGRALLDAGRTEQAIVHLKLATGQNPRYTLALKNLGNAYVRQRKWAQAAASLSAAVDIQPDYCDAHFDRASVLEQLGRPADARAGFETALGCGLAPNVASIAQLRLGLMLSQEEKYDQAVRRFEEAVKLDPRSVEARRNYAVTLGLLGRFDQAAQEFSAVLSLAPGDAEARKAIQMLESRPRP